MKSIKYYNRGMSLNIKKVLNIIVFVQCGLVHFFIDDNNTCQSQTLEGLKSKTVKFIVVVFNGSLYPFVY